MILPIGKDGFSFKSLPWITLSIILLNIFVHILVIEHDKPIYKEINKLELEYIDFWFDNPFLPFQDEWISYENYYRTYDDVENKLKELSGKKLPKLGDEEYDSAWNLKEEILNDIRVTNRKRARYKYGHNRLRPTFITHFTHVFMHGDWRHLFFNMLFLYFTAPFLEELWGKRIFLAFYLLAGIFSTIGPDLIHPYHVANSVGSSGAISGVIGAFLMRFWNEKLRFLWWSGWMIPFRAPGWIMAIFEIGRQFYYARLQDADPDGGWGIGFWAHFSGLVFGVIVVILLKKLKRNGKNIETVVEKRHQFEDEGHLIYQKAMDYQLNGRKDKAYELLLEGVKDHPTNADIVDQIWTLGRTFGHKEKNIGYLKNLIEWEVKKGKIEMAMVHFDTMRSHFPSERISDQAMILLIERLIKIEDIDRAKDLAEEVTRGINEKTPEGIILQLDKLLGST